MKQPARRLPQAGLTLIELMVSMVIGLLIVLALITLLINVNRNNSEMGKTNRVIENGRFALQLLQTDISHAGYWGGFIPKFDDLTASAAPTDAPTAVPDPCLAYASWNVAPYTVTGPPLVSHKSNLIGIAVQGYEIPAVVPSPTLSVCADKVTRPKASTDVLFVRHAENCVPGVGDCPAFTAGELYFQAARCGTTVPSPAYVLDSDATLLTLQNRDCATTAELRKFVSSLYYIRDYAVTAGDGIPTLMRSQFGLSGGTLGHKAAEALIEGIEGFRVEYGIDNISDSGEAVDFAEEVKWADPVNLTSPRNRGDGIPDNAYVRCTTAAPCTADQLMNAVAVKLYVLVRSEKATPGYTDTKKYEMGSTTLGPFNDAYKRHLFTQTVRLTNISGRRETP
ncbi:MAG: PilW family protein [Polaromonas sp.]|nr:PilW family protein [Polaromonas sp.]